MPAEPTHPPILVAGAGIGGLTAALALARHGIAVEVYERHPRAVVRGGTGLTVWSNATTLLAELGVGEELTARSERVRSGRSVNQDDRVIYEMEPERFLWRGAAPAISISRGDLIDTLFAACEKAGVPIHLGRRCAGYRVVRGDGDTVGVELELEDGERVPGSALVGADGIRSRILAALHGGPPEPHYTGRSTFRGISPSAQGLEPGLVYMFHDSASGAGGGAWHVGGDRVAWTLSQAMPPGPRDEAGVAKQRAVELVAGLPGLPSRLVHATDGDDVMRTDIFYHDWRERWGDGPVTLIGDAAHAMPTEFGQGACQAVEDAVVLADSIATGRDVVSGLREYERRRRPRVKWVRDQVFKLVRWPKLGNPLLRWLVNHVIAPPVVALSQRRLWRGLQRPPRLRARIPASGALR